LAPFLHQSNQTAYQNKYRQQWLMGKKHQEKGSKALPIWEEDNGRR
jgi:hypothetical protein